VRSSRDAVRSRRWHVLQEYCTCAGRCKPG